MDVWIHCGCTLVLPYISQPVSGLHTQCDESNNQVRKCRHLGTAFSEEDYNLKLEVDTVLPLLADMTAALPQLPQFIGSSLRATGTCRPPAVVLKTGISCSIRSKGEARSENGPAPPAPATDDNNGADNCRHGRGHKSGNMCECLFIVLIFFTCTTSKKLFFSLVKPTEKYCCL